MSFKFLLNSIGTKKGYPSLNKSNPIHSSSNKKKDLFLNPKSIKTKSKTYSRRKKGGRVFNQNAIKNPFFLSGITDQKTKSIWVYIDEDEQLQGPFSSDQMDFWFKNRSFFLFDDE